MKKTVDGKTYFFVDESGDPVFFNKYGTNIVGKEGCAPILLLGLIRTTDPEPLREALQQLRTEIMMDKYLAHIPSIQARTQFAFHAKDDCAEVRERVFKLLSTMDFKAEFIVARKIESVFRGRHKSKENIFYDDLVTKLFENKLHSSTENEIYYAVRGSRKRQQPFDDAIRTAVLTFESKWKTTVNSHIEVYAQTSQGEPCLQIVDYMNWAVQRAFCRSEDRYIEFIKEKVSYLVDIYDFPNYPKNYYNKRSNIFGINKISPL